MFIDEAPANGVDVKRARSSRDQQSDAQLATTPAESAQPDRENSEDHPKDWSAFYLIKSEPSDYSIDDLAKEEGQTTCWGAPRPLAYNELTCHASLSTAS
jgi:hypothetical protein